MSYWCCFRTGSWWGGWWRSLEAYCRWSWPTTWGNSAIRWTYWVMWWWYGSSSTSNPSLINIDDTLIKICLKPLIFPQSSYWFGSIEFHILVFVIAGPYSSLNGAWSPSQCICLILPSFCRPMHPTTIRWTIHYLWENGALPPHWGNCPICNTLYPCYEPIYFISFASPKFHSYPSMLMSMNSLFRCACEMMMVSYPSMVGYEWSPQDRCWISTSWMA